MKQFKITAAATNDEGRPFLGIVLALPLSLLAWAAIGEIIHVFL